MWKINLSFLKSYKKMFTFVSRQTFYNWITGRVYPTCSQFLEIFQKINKNPASAFLPIDVDFNKNFPVGFGSEIFDIDIDTLYYFDVKGQLVSLTFHRNFMRIVFYSFNDDGSLTVRETVYLKYK